MADNKREIERQNLYKSLWDIATSCRGKIDGWDFKNYIFGFMFYRYLSEKTIPVSLSESADTWAEIALDDTVKNTEFDSIEKYDMRREIHRLERLYQGQQDV